MAPKGRTQTGLGGTTTLEANEGVRKHPKIPEVGAVVTWQGSPWLCLLDTITVLGSLEGEGPRLWHEGVIGLTGKVEDGGSSPYPLQPLLPTEPVFSGAFVSLCPEGADTGPVPGLVHEELGEVRLRLVLRIEVGEPLVCTGHLWAWGTSWGM